MPDLRWEPAARPPAPAPDVRAGDEWWGEDVWAVPRDAEWGAEWWDEPSPGRVMRRPG
jgi:hypothetical protein